MLIVEHDIDRVLELLSSRHSDEPGRSADDWHARKRFAQIGGVQEVYTGTGRPAATGRGASDKCWQHASCVSDNVNAFYGKSHILSDATLDVRNDEIVALLGRNGAGKSTLLKTLCGLVPPASGTIEFGGKTIRGLPTSDIARMGIGYVPQGAASLPV